MLAGACGVCVGLVAGCGGGDSDTAGGTSGTGTTSGTGGSSPSAAGSAPGSPSASASASSGGAATGLVALADVPVGGAVAATAADGSPLLVAQPTAGDVVAFSAVCPHQGATVEVVGGNQLYCPRHGSAFNVSDGAVVQGPAEQGLRAVAVRVEGDQVVAG
ncbi:Rieske (2Fe-2S) protein [Motilibacter sp. E257]|uniref:Cytochrome bc1 complex Rieske iron-sulfur subunit n=1 Tax=Motilibacter deserti TaxID=2714956 RepID=A0ABX0H393_9ACTN|nr:Rieske (2Fe-2S) protein [Motilibacter deserti]